MYRYGLDRGSNPFSGKDRITLKYYQIKFQSSYNTCSDSICVEVVWKYKWLDQLIKRKVNE